MNVLEVPKFVGEPHTSAYDSMRERVLIAPSLLRKIIECDGLLQLQDPVSLQLILELFCIKTFLKSINETIEMQSHWGGFSI